MVVMMVESMVELLVDYLDLLAAEMKVDLLELR